MTRENAIQLLQRYRIPHPGALEARGSYRFYGALFVVAALVMGIFPVLSLANRGPDGLWALVGFLALFALLGLFIAGFWEELDVSADGVRHRTGSWFRKEEHHAPREALERVRLMRYVERRGRDRRTLYAPELVFRAPGFPETLRIGASSREERAREAAEEIARGLELVFEDVLGDEPIVRGPAELDVPAIPAEASSEPVPRNVLSGWESGNEVRLRGTLRPGGAALAIGAGILMLVVPVAALGLVLGWVRDTRALFIAVPVAAPGIFFMAWGILAALSQEHVAVTPEAVVRSRQLGPLTWSRRTIPRSEIESLRVQTKGRYGLAVVTDRRTWILGPALDGSGLRWLRSWLAGRLA